MSSPCSVVWNYAIRVVCIHVLFLCNGKNFPQRHAFSLERRSGTDFDYTLCGWLPVPLFLLSSYSVWRLRKSLMLLFLFILFPYVAFRFDLQVLVSLGPSAPLLCQSWPFSRLLPGRTLAECPWLSPTDNRCNISFVIWIRDICHEWMNIKHALKIISDFLKWLVFLFLISHLKQQAIIKLYTIFNKLIAV